MADGHQYPVFFECHGLLWTQIKKIENYFRIRRRSGGGECGPLRTVDDKVYSVAFKYHRDQQTVLQRSVHEVDGLVFTVRDSLEPQTSTAKDFTAPEQSPESIPASTPPPSGEEYELQVDSYLLQYLRECPKAEKKLEDELTSVACTAQLYPEDGRVLVKRLAHAGAVDAQNWKAKVDQLFGGYTCYYEVDPHKTQALLQSCSSPQATDEVKVYSEDGMAVVVGECSHVNARLMDVENSHVKHEEKTSVYRRFIKAKLRLLWREIEHSLGQDFPGVKVTQAEPGQIMLEGSVKELLKAGELITDLENLVSERRISDMSPHVLAFLKKAHGGPGELTDFLQVSGRVEVELRDTELCLFTFSADKLDETEAALQRKIKEVKIELPNCSSVPHELQEKLMLKTNEMNQGQYTAEAVFGTDNMVHLLGHAKEVEELSEAVTQFIVDHSSFESVVYLPFPDLAQELPQLLQLFKFDHSGVTFHPLSSPSGPVVLLEGPSRKVSEVRNRLDPFLDSLLEDYVTTDQLEEVRYLRGPARNDDFQNVAGKLASLTLGETATTVASYSLCDGLQVVVCQGDITKQDADALVNAANEDLDHGGGVAAALSKAGGPEVQRESSALVKYVGKIPTGKVVVTTGGNLRCKKLLHAVGPVGGKSGGKERAILEKTVQSALDLAEVFEFRSIAMPCISSGTFGVPVDLCSEAIATAVKKFGSQGGRSLSSITLIDNRGEVVRAMQEACDRLLQGMTTRDSAPSHLGLQLGVDGQDTARGAAAGGPEDVVPLEIIQGTIETQQAFKSAQEVFHQKGFTKDFHQQGEGSATKRIVLLGKTGSGKSNLANTIIGEKLFTTNHSLNSGTSVCQSETKSVNGRSVTLIDTPGFFDAGRSEEDLKPDIVRCITECAPGPHAFLIVLKVEKFTEQEQAVINKICQYFSEDALKYAVIVFTHGDQLPKGIKIEEFVSQNKNLSNQVEKCGGRCCVIDNKYWNNKVQNNYRSNQFQVEELLKTIDTMVMENNGGYYVNKMFETVEKEIQMEEAAIRKTSGNMPEEEIRKQAKGRVSNRFLIQLAGTATGAVLGAFCGVAAMVELVIRALRSTSVMMKLVNNPGLKGAASAAATAAGGAGGAEVALVAVGVTAGVAAATGGVIGGVTGHDAAEGAETPREAAERAANAVLDKGKSVFGGEGC